MKIKSVIVTFEDDVDSLSNISLDDENLQCDHTGESMRFMKNFQITKCFHYNHFTKSILLKNKDISLKYKNIFIINMRNYTYKLLKTDEVIETYEKSNSCLSLVTCSQKCSADTFCTGFSKDEKDFKLYYSAIISTDSNDSGTLFFKKSELFSKSYC